MAPPGRSVTFEGRVVHLLNGVHGVLHPLHVHEGVVLDNVTLHHRAELLKLAAQDAAGDALSQIADVQLGGGLGPPFADLHVHGPAVQFVLVKVLNGLLRLKRVGHVDKPIVFDNVTF